MSAIFDTLCPMHARLGAHGHIVHAGPTLQRIHPEGDLRGRRGSGRSARVTGAPSASASGTSIERIMCWTMCTLSSVVSYAASPEAVAK